MSQIILCPQCLLKYADEEDKGGMCDSCYTEAMQDEHEYHLKGCVSELIKLKGKAYVSHLINCHE